MRSNANRAVAAVTAAAIALTTAGMAPAFAASSTAKNTAAENTDFSSGHYYRGHRYRNNAAGAAAFAAIVGGIAAYAAAREYRKARERSYYHGGYYGEPYGYYGGSRYYRY